jgi:nicotinamidase-related amidase
MTFDVLVVIDMQKFFFVENREVDQQGLAGSCQEIIDISREAGVPVIHVTTQYRQDGRDWPSAWAGDPQSWCSNLVAGSDLSGVVDGIVVKTEDLVVHKKRFSAFYNTNLDDLLRSLECSRIFLVGYSADVCIRFTSVDAYNRGYRVGLVVDGIESFREAKEESVAYLEWTIGAECVSTEGYRKIVLESARTQYSDAGG